MPDFPLKMMEAKDVLLVGDELNLYLVANGIKPAALLYISARDHRLNHVVNREELQLLCWKRLELRLKDTTLQEFDALLDGLGIQYQRKVRSSTRNHKENFFYFFPMLGRKKAFDYNFQIGSNTENLERLLRAQNDNEFGSALGFPREAIDSFDKVINGERRNGTYFEVSLARAKQAGIELPTWLAYTSFIPDNLDFVRGNVSPSSERLGKQYQDFVRKKNPELAARVEQHFSDRELPSDWRLTKNGSYNLKYNRPRT